MRREYKVAWATFFLAVAYGIINFGTSGHTAEPTSKQLRPHVTHVKEPEVESNPIPIVQAASPILKERKKLDGVIATLYNESPRARMRYTTFVQSRPNDAGPTLKATSSTVLIFPICV